MSQRPALTPEQERAVEMLDIPPQYRKWTLDDYSQAVRLALAPFLAGYRWSAFLCGGVGTRKTSLAAAMLRRWRVSGKPSGGAPYGEFVQPSRFTSLARDMDNGRVALASWRKASILVLDDVSAYRNTPHIVETLLLLLSARYDDVRPTIITSNLRLPELATHLDPRIASRLQDGVCVDLGDVDTRGKA
jgi:DNA replication protein DnaC/primosomal protein DnaI